MPIPANYYYYILLLLTHVELETDCDKLILAGKRLRSLSVMKEYLQQNYEGIAFNLKHMPLPSITGRINVSDLCIQFPDVAFVQDDSGKMNVVGLKDNVDFCIEARNTQPKKYATKMDTSFTNHMQHPKQHESYGYFSVNIGFVIQNNMLFWMTNPMLTLKYPYDSWSTLG